MSRAHTEQHGQATLVAFISADDAVDRSGAIANLAWVLASAEQSVLVLDLADAVHRVADYLTPFMAGTSSPHEVGNSPAREFTTAFGLPSPETLAATSFVLPADRGTIEILTSQAIDPTRGGGDADRLRAKLVQSSYNYVIINAPSLREQSEGGAGATYDLVARMCDVAVLCFSHRRSAVAEAASIGQSLHRLAPGGIQLVPLALLHGGVQLTAGVGRSDPDTRFAELLAANPRRESDVLSVPEVATDTPVLALLTELPTAERPITDAYIRLADAVTFGAVRSIGDTPASYIARYRRSVGIADSGTPDHFLVAYAPADRRWADWVIAELRAAGAQVSTLREGGTTPEPVELVVVGSPTFPQYGQHLAIGDLDGRFAGRTQIIVGETEALPGMTVLTLAGADAELAAVKLHTHFGLLRPPGAPERQPATVRHPSSRPVVVQLPPRRAAVVGRDDAIEDIRDHLLYGDGAPVTVAGPPGVGKTELAREYADRFMTDYDVVWWIPAYDRESVLASVMMLSRRLREVTTADVPGPLRLLHSDRVTDRWLLIFAHADSAELYEDLLPQPARGHIIIASGTDSGLTVPPLSADASAVVLRRLLPGLDEPEQITRLTEVLGHVPLALELAAAWLADETRRRTSVPDAARQTSREVLDEFAVRLGTTASDADHVTRVITVMSASLGKTVEGRLTLLLAQFCSFLSPQGASLGLLRSGAVIGKLAELGGPDAVRLTADVAEIDQLLGYGHRLRLFQVDWGPARTVTLSRVVRQTLQHTLPEGYRQRLQEQVLLALAQYAPTELEMNEPGSSLRFADLNRHIMSTGAEETSDPAVRQWLVNQVRYLFRTSEPDLWELALEPVRQLLEKWRAEHTEKDPFVCLLQAQLANLYRGLGEFDKAFELNSHALDNLRLMRSPTHFRALLTAGGLGADLRALGRFDDALDEDIATLAGLREAFGEDHPLTLAAQSNLVVSYFHAGDFTRALELAHVHHEHRVRLLGDDDQGRWQALANLGVYERVVGQTAASIETLRLARDLAVGRFSPTAPQVVMVNWLRSISLRLDPAEDNTSAKSLNAEALRDMRDVLGEGHPQTLACKLSYATAHRVIGEPATAVLLAEAALAGFLARPGMPENHPSPAICRVELGLALASAGQNEEAIEPARSGLNALTASLGPAHPYTIAARIDHAAVLAAAGRADEARTAADEAVLASADYLKVNHRYRRIAEANQQAARDQELEWQTIDLDISMP